MSPRLLTLLLVLLLTTPGLLAQDLADLETYHEKWDLPDRPIGRRASHMLEAISRKDSAFTHNMVVTAMDEGFQQMGIPHLINSVHTWGNQLGDFSIDKAVIKRPFRVELYLLGEDEVLYKMNLEVIDAFPHLFAGILPPQPFDPENEIGEVPAFTSLEEAHAYTQDLESRGLFSGVILLRENGETVFAETYGFFNKEEQLPVNLDTRFNLGSITKSFTRAAIMKLAEDNKLNLEDPMGTYLPQFPEDIGSQVTIQQLVDMTSGYGDYGMEDHYRFNKKSYRTIDDYMNLMKEKTLYSTPGEVERYSNAGYAILAGIIEAASGMSYYDYVTDHILTPAGMPNAGFPFSDALGENTARGYTNEGQSGKKGYVDWANQYRPGRGSGAGGAYGSAPEMATYMENRMMQRGPGGCNAGGAPGVSTVSCWHTEKGLVLVVLSNQDEPYPEDLAVSIYRMLVPAQKQNDQGGDAEAKTSNFAETWGFPGSYMGQRAAHLMEAFKRGDATFTQAFIEEAFTEEFKAIASMDEHLEQFKQIHDMLGPFEVVSIERGGPEKAVLLLRNGLGELRQVELDVDSQPPHLIGGIMIQPASEN